MKFTIKIVLLLYITFASLSGCGSGGPGERPDNAQAEPPLNHTDPDWEGHDPVPRGDPDDRPANGPPEHPPGRADGNGGQTNNASDILDGEVVKFLDDWRLAWESRDISRYMDFYDPETFFGRNYSPSTGYTLLPYNEWLADKERKFQTAKSISVFIGEMNIYKNDQIEVSFFQNYRSDRYHDIGTKTLVVRRMGEVLKISWEEWRPGNEPEVLGESVEGRSIYFKKWGNGRERVLIIGAIHGDEKPSAHLVRRYEQRLEVHPELLDGVTLLTIPEINPDGFANGTRQNANGVDLNRNFKARNFKRGEQGDRYYGGEKPLSEPESRHLANLIEKIKPARILTIHTPLNLINYDGPPGTEDIARVVSKVSGLELEESVGYPTQGSLGSWAGKDMQIPVITLELPPEGLQSGEEFERLIIAIDEFLQFKTQ